MRNFILLLLTILLTTFFSYGQVKQNTVPNIKNPFQKKQHQTNRPSISPPSVFQKQESENKIKTRDGSFMVSFDDKKSSAKRINTSKSNTELANQFNDWFGLNPDFSFRLVSEKTDAIKTTHYNYKQYYKDYPIYGGTVLLHFKQGNAYAVNGKIAEFDELDTSVSITEAQALENAKAYKNVTELIKDYPIEKLIYKLPSENKTTYTLAYKVRIDAYQPYVMANVFVDVKTGEVIEDISLIAHTDTDATANTLYSGTQTITTDYTNGIYTLKDNARNIETYDSTNTLEGGGPVIYSNNSTNWTGAPVLEKITISKLSPNWWQQYSLIDKEPDIYIKIKDASGNIIFNSIEKRKNNVLPTPTKPLTISVGLYLGNPPYTYEIWDYDIVGSDDFGGSRLIDIQNGLIDWNIEDNKGSYLIGSDTSNAALDVHWGMGVTYDFFLETFGRTSYDDSGGAIKSYLNPPRYQKSIGMPPNNASALGPPYNITEYGLGDGEEYGPFVEIEVVAHEFTHLVIKNIDDGILDYNKEPGALNESFADIFGTCIEFYSGVNPNWQHGEDIKIKENDAISDMSEPNKFNHPNTYLGKHWQDTNSSWDKGGIHTNSGVQNYWFYLLSNGGVGQNDNGDNYSVNGIGIDKAARIAYKNLTTYLCKTSNYKDAYEGSLRAAQDLYGDSSQEYKSVREAWYAVGIGNDPDKQCSGTTRLVTEAGSFSDGSGSLGNYNSNANCKWVIAPAGATQITLNFTEFDTEPTFDKVTVYDGPDETYPVLETWWGNTLPPTLKTTIGVGAMTVVFTSDESENYAGWSAKYTSSVVPPSCSGFNSLTNESDSFSDGSGSDDYVNNQRCIWYIAPPCAESITLNFTEFDTELDYDGVVVYDDLYLTNKIGQFTGNTIPPSITSTTGEMIVAFISDFAVNKSGFNASYTSTGTTDYSLSNTVLNTADFGSISDGSGENDYCNNTTSSWLIQPPDATSIQLVFENFELQEGSRDGLSKNDYVTVYDGPDINSPILGEYTGKTIPPRLTSTGGSMLITFDSDYSITGKGWDAFFTSTQESYCSNSVLTGESATFGDGSGDKLYSNNSVCSWLIQPNNGEVINLNFSKFDTELDYDGLIVYDGVDETADILGIFTGNTLPNTITSSGNSLFVLFLSDELNRKDGFTANYETTTLGLEDDFYKYNLNITPNPTSSVVSFDNSEAEFESLEIFNLLGQSLSRRALESPEDNTADISNYEDGIYLFRFMKEGRFVTFKVIKN